MCMVQRPTALVLQENEAELFTKKSVWRTLKINLKEGAHRVSDTFSLWRSGIQSVEGKHGERCRSKLRLSACPCTARLLACMRQARSQRHWQGLHSTVVTAILDF